MKRVLPALSIVSVILALVAPSAAQSVAPLDLPARLREVAASYRNYGRVDDLMRWAPYMCDLPPPSQARVSRAETVHARKVYFIYASDRQRYLQATGVYDPAPPSIGLTVVKESFEPVELEARMPQPLFGEREIPGPHSLTLRHEIYRPITVGDHHIGAGAPTGLFVMQYVGRHTPGTDAGWVYGTVAANGEVTSAGLNETCMGCHRAAPHGRLFGLADAEL